VVSFFYSLPDVVEKERLSASGDTSHSYSLLCAPAGTGLRQAVARLQLVAPFAHADVEDVLSQSRETEEALRRAGRERPSKAASWPNMFEVTWALSRFEVMKLWKTAVSDALRKLRDAQEEDKILSSHFVYYCGRRTEFYSPVNTDVLKEYGAKPSRIMVLVDDVFDMFFRLCGANQLFDTNYQMDTLRGGLIEEEDVFMDKTPASEVARNVMEWQVGIMTQLLYWRQLEILTAERVATELDIEFLVYGTKQSAEVASSWLRATTHSSAYLSHPISRPRRVFLEKRKWPSVVEQFNQLQSLLSKYALVAVMPTAIDEYRIDRKKRPGRTAVRRPKLSSRWPLPVPGESSLYSLPDGVGDMHHSDLLSPKRWDFRKRKFVGVRPNVQWFNSASSVLSAFEHQIEWQVSSRDHLLVSWCKNVLVFRPFYQESVWSGGVQAEITHWKLHAATDATRRIGFIHFKEDANLLLKTVGANQMLTEERKSTIARKTSEIVGARHRLNMNVASGIVDFILKGKPAGILDKAPVNPQIIGPIETSLPQYSKTARAEWLFEKLTGADFGHVPPEKLRSQVGLWIVGESSELPGRCEAIAEFFKSGKGTDVNDLLGLDWVIGRG